MKNLITLTLTIAILISCNLSVFGAVNPLNKKKQGDYGKERFVLKNSGKTIEKLSSDKIIPNKIHIKTRQYAKKQNTFWGSFKKLLEINSQNTAYSLNLLELKGLQKIDLEKIFVAVNQSIR